MKQRKGQMIKTRVSSKMERGSMISPMNAAKAKQLSFAKLSVSI
jgi:hypothetical protein